MSNLGYAYTDLGVVERAIAACEAARTIAQAIGDRRAEGYSLSYLARAQSYHSDAAAASTTFVQAGALLHAVGDRAGEAECRWHFGLALARWDEQERALPLLRAAVAYEQEIGYAKAEEHAALLTRLEEGEALPPDLLHPASQRAVGADEDVPTNDDEQP